MKFKPTGVLESNDHRFVRCIIDCAWWLMVPIWMYWGVTALLAICLEGAMSADVAVGDLFFRQLLSLETIMALPVLLPLAITGALGYSELSASLQKGIGFVSRICFRAFGLLFLLSIIFGWVHYSYSGRFPSLDSCLFYLKSPVHLFEHALQFSPIGLLVLFFVSVSLYLILIFWIPMVMRRLSVRMRAILSGAGVASFALFLFLNPPWAILEIKGSEVGRLRLSSRDPSVLTSTVEDYVEGLLLSRSGPWTSLILPSKRQERIFVPDESVLRASYSERIDLEDYSKLVQVVSGEDFSCPNVIILLVESLRADEVDAVGVAEPTMPNLEALIADGLLFNNHYSSSSHSSYADISVISGVYPLWESIIHVYPNQAHYPRPRLYDLLNVMGSRTGIFSSQNENWGGMLNYLHSDRLDVFYHAGDLSAGERCLTRAFQLNRGKGFDRDTVDVALKWMEADSSPFFAYINLQGSHYPYYFPESKPRPFGAEFDTGELNFLNFPAEVIPYVRPRYRDSLYYVDQHIGRLVAELKKTGAWANTLLVVTGDTGQAFREHGFSGHARDLFDEVVRTPLVLSGGALSRTGVEDRLSQHVDIAPTVLDLAGLPAYSGFQGLSLVGTQERTWAPLVCQSPALKQLAVVTPSHKLMYDWDTGGVHLFNLLVDPGELNPQNSESECGLELQSLLETWASHQIDYYRNTERYTRFFAPSYSSPSLCPLN
ncbi:MULTISPECIES: sulfatase [unclassified Lentimonas]|uniref:sulfatase n=1 Tax=unclassified Lentimonas TaxID=2630993 RepID=UPI0013896B35|nr:MULTISPECIES: sulfatase [unclassified Lentimonas]